MNKIASNSCSYFLNFVLSHFVSKWNILNILVSFLANRNHFVNICTNQANNVICTQSSSVILFPSRKRIFLGEVMSDGFL